MALLHFELAYPGGFSERLRIDHHRVLLGSADHCEIRLPADQSAPETLLIEQREGEIFAEALSSQVTPSADGRPLLLGLVRAGAAIQIGTMVVRVWLADPVSAPKKRALKPRVIVLALAFTGLATYAATQDFSAGSGFVLPAQAPALWASDGGVCPQSDPVAAFALAEELRGIANSKRERSPFVPREGVTAVQFYRDAAACYLRGDRAREARELEADARQLERAMRDAYHVARLRLERSLASGDTPLALTQIAVLKSMLEERPGAYTQALADLERYLRVRAGEGAS